MDTIKLKEKFDRLEELYSDDYQLSEGSLEANLSYLKLAMLRDLREVFCGSEDEGRATGESNE